MLFYILLPLALLPMLILFPTKVLHRERMPKGKAIVTSNHFSNIDSIIYFAQFRKFFRFVGKKELCKNKFSHWFFKNMGMIIVDRENLSVSSYKEILANLKKDRAVFIFPEGTRNKTDDENLQAVKNGIITFASKGECEIVPMVLYKKPKIFRKNYILVGEPLKIEGENPKKLSKEEELANLDRYVETMNNLRKELDEYVFNKKHKKNKKNKN